MLFDFGISAADRVRLRRIERKLDMIIEHFGIESAEDDSGLPPEVREPADAGEKIEAIKAHRDKFGSSLLEAKNAVEAYLRK